MKISKFKNLFIKKEQVNTDALLDDIFSLVIQVEEKHHKIEKQYLDLQKNVSATIKNEKLLHALVQISSILISKEIMCPDLQDAFDILIPILGIDKVFISRIIDKTFAKKIYEWQITGTEMINQGVQIDSNNSPGLFDVINDGKPFILKNSLGKEKKYIDKYNIIDACMFPLFVSGKVWGMIGFVSYNEKADWNSENKNICGLLSSLFSTHIQNKTLIKKLNRIKNEVTNG